MKNLSETQDIGRDGLVRAAVSRIVNDIKNQPEEESDLTYEQKVKIYEDNIVWFARQIVDEMVKISSAYLNCSAEEVAVCICRFIREGKSRF